MRKKILLLAAMVVASSTTIDAQRKFPFFWKKKKAKTEQTTPAKKESEYDKLFKKKHEIAENASDRKLQHSTGDTTRYITFEGPLSESYRSSSL